MIIEVQKSVFQRKNKKQTNSLCLLLLKDRKVIPTFYESNAIQPQSLASYYPIKLQQSKGCFGNFITYQLYKKKRRSNHDSFPQIKTMTSHSCIISRATAAFALLSLLFSAAFHDTLADSSSVCMSYPVFNIRASQSTKIDVSGTLVGLPGATRYIYSFVDSTVSYIFIPEGVVIILWLIM